ncbi:type IV secretory system conjugative DNA transfer family protein (plasmid) [Acinetobacter haemolyticus]|uniref:type IV secretory system conjugative DNA transfer family protein n=1 Tax=Acinetobacter haemolyticus TaxID=29430 RepID=UPI001331DAC0|nr:type IV secretion system DNA-binding domain-containing protein [Acinetobacter haemolyticus]QHI24744.1 type IV secretory system conjugative DNA transfer family protein [Acinetobacter haemolyticus]
MISNFVNGVLNSGVSKYIIFATFSFLPVFFSGSVVVKYAHSTARKRIEGGNTKTQTFLKYWFCYFISIALIITAFVTQTDFTLSWMLKVYFFWGLPAVFYMLYFLRKLTIRDDLYFFLSKEEKEIYNNQNKNNKTESNIEKYIDIENRDALLEKLEVTEESTAPLLWFGDKLEDDLWSENRLKARVSIEDRGMVVGAPGSGKTAFLIAQVVDWMQSGRSVVLTDVKPEIYGRLLEAGVFERYGYTPTVFNPTDIHSHAYNLFSESSSSAELNEILSVIIPYTDDSSEVFAENARRLLKAVLLELGEEASLPNAQKFINSEDNIADLLKILKRSSNDSVSAIASEIGRTAKNENLLASIFTSLSKAFAFLDDDRIRKQVQRSDFSLKKLLVQPKQILFLQFEQEFRSSTATIFGAMVAQTLRILQTNCRNRDAVFVALDEIINCAPIPNFTSTLNMIRSAKMPTFLYFQSLEGLNRLYGNDAERLIMGSADLKVVFRIGDDETCQTFSRMLGETEAVIRSSTQNSATSSTPNVHNPAVLLNNDIISNSTGVTSSANTSILAIFEPEKFQRLEQHTAICLYKGRSALSAMPCFYDDYGIKEENWPKEPTFTTLGEIAESRKTA